MRREGTSIGQFRIDRLLGHGGMGAVYVATDEMTGREVAVKLLRPDLLSAPGFVERFKAEARTLARLDHPRIARLHGFFRHDDDLLMVMEYVRGTTLADLLRTSGAVGTQTAVTWTLDVLEALRYAHHLGIVHRDVKPANIIVEDGSRRARLTDFGIARSEVEGRLTQTGQTVGTIAYMAPEQLTTTAADGRADLYALAVVTFEMLTGSIPYTATTTFTLMREVADGSAARALDRLPASAAPLREVLRTALSADPTQRFADAGAFADALRQAWTDVPAAVGHPTAATTMAQPVVAAGTTAVWRRGPVVAAVVLGAVMLLGAGVVWSRRTDPPATAAPAATTAADDDRATTTPTVAADADAQGAASAPAGSSDAQVVRPAATGPGGDRARPAATARTRAANSAVPSAVTGPPTAPAAVDASTDASEGRDEPASPAPAPARAARAPAEFSRVLLMMEITEDDETETEEVDVLLRFDGERLLVLDAETRVPLSRPRYGAIRRATYSQVQSRIRLFRGPAHWLDLQVGGGHVVLRLDKRNAEAVLDELAARGVAVQRASRQ